MIDDVQINEQIVVKGLLERLRTWLILEVSQGDPSTNTLRLEIAPRPSRSTLQSAVASSELAGTNVWMFTR